MSRPAPRTKGHWPKGRRRHAEGPGWAAARAALAALLADHFRPGEISMGQCAEACGVAGGTRTVARWLSGQAMPSPDHQAAVARWVRRQLARIEAQA